MIHPIQKSYSCPAALSVEMPDAAIPKPQPDSVTDTSPMLAGSDKALVEKHSSLGSGTASAPGVTKGADASILSAEPKPLPPQLSVDKGFVEQIENLVQERETLVREDIKELDLRVCLANKMAGVDPKGTSVHLTVALLKKDVEEILGDQNGYFTQTEKDVLKEAIQNFQSIFVQGKESPCFYLNQPATEAKWRDAFNKLAPGESCIYATEGSAPEFEYATHAICIEMEKTDGGSLRYYVHNSGYGNPKENKLQDETQPRKSVKSSVHQIAKEKTAEFIHSLSYLMPTDSRDATKDHRPIADFYTIPKECGGEDLTASNERYRLWQKAEDCTFECNLAALEDKCQRLFTARGLGAECGKSLVDAVRQNLYRSAVDALKASAEDDEGLDELLLGQVDISGKQEGSHFEDAESGDPDIEKAIRELEGLRNDFGNYHSLQTPRQSESRTTRFAVN